MLASGCTSGCVDARVVVSAAESSSTMPATGNGDSGAPDDPSMGNTDDATSAGSAESTGVGGSTGEPLCCGGLCTDARWSCSDATCVGADGNALALVPEAGFFEVGGGTLVAAGWSGSVPTARVFYSFHPADQAPEDKPLLVFFNGGPGQSTVLLLGLNTAPVTLDPERGGPGPNPASWTRFANLLHIDAPATGFSYSMPNPSGARPEIGFEAHYDAATFVRVVLRFLDHHRQLDDARVVLVGESYGGVRATVMLEHLLHHAEIADSHYPDVLLADEIDAWYDRVLGPGDHPPEEVASRFAAVLVQPLLACQGQRDRPFVGPCADEYQCDAPGGTSRSLGLALRDDICDLDVLNEVLGVDATSIAWLHADERTTAYRRTLPSDQRGAEVELTAAMGMLGVEDSYFALFEDAMFANPEFPDYCPEWDGRRFLDLARHVPVFVTHAGQDGAVPSEGLVDALAALDDRVTAVTVDATSPEGAERPGLLRLAYVDGTEQALRFPEYAAAGHTVTWRAGPELADHVGAWLATLGR